MDFYIGDTHFGHENIVKYCGRPFKHALDMEETIIKNWNSAVGKNDTVYHLGDFSLYYSNVEKQQMLDRLNGRKVLIIGNHDIYRIGHWKKLGVEAHKKFIVHDGLILSHVPIMFPELPNVHGHTHGNVHRGEIPEHGVFVCVSVEAIRYTPVNTQWIRDEIGLKLQEKAVKKEEKGG